MTNKSLLSKLLILLFVCSTFGASNNDNRVVVDVKSLTLYNSWKLQNVRIFVNEDEKIFRQLVFFENLKKIDENNADPKNTFKMALTQFSDMTDEEFNEKILNTEMLKPQPNGLSLDNDDHGDIPVPDPIPDPNPVVPPAALLTAVNWKTRGYVTSVKDQGHCGSCWAFSATGVMESFNMMKNRNTKLFSEQQLIDCVNTSVGYNSYGCIGGWPHHALSYSYRFGVLQSHQYPYTSYSGVTGRCRVSARTAGFYPRSFYKVATTVTGLRTALNSSPVSVALDATGWKQYGGGVFNRCPSSVRLNHAVLAVGYDSAGNWILKNSWGGNWGERGYITLKGGNNCGILSSSYRVTA